MFAVILVSTDDPAIAQLAIDSGAVAPFLRGEELTRDTVEVPEVIRHALNWYVQNQHQHFDWVCVLQPTSPLRTAQHLVESRHLLQSDPAADSLISITRYHHHPGWALRIEAGVVIPDNPATASASRQHLPPLFHPDGAIYWQKASRVLAEATTYSGRVIPYYTPPGVGLDVDYPEDLELAEWLMNRSREYPRQDFGIG
ncbi:MAG: N-acylneuraminate cytidylyltransferase [Phycisphaerae bacterium]|nr:N-acylneuraminate cytidylyltransferase [Phycisphaerae bacterium]